MHEGGGGLVAHVLAELRASNAGIQSGSVFILQDKSSRNSRLASSSARERFVGDSTSYQNGREDVSSRMLISLGIGEVGKLCGVSRALRGNGERTLASTAMA